MLRPLRIPFFFGLLIATLTFCTPCLQAQTLTVLHNFSGLGDGGNPSSGLAMDAAGNLYGTTIFGGSHGYGVVFKLKRSGSNWSEVPLYSFSGFDDGSQPYTTPLLTPDGTLYGANYGQERECCGALFHLQPSPAVPRSVLTPWNLDLIHHFTGGADGAYPNGDIAMDTSGGIYGTTQSGGPSNQGTIYKFIHSNGTWEESVLYAADGGADGGYPRGNVVLDPAGNVYGVFMEDGPNGYGAVYVLSPSGSGWTESTVYAFTGTSDGGVPKGGLLRDQSGNLYGTTTFTPGPNGGTVFELSPSGNGWSLQVLYSFVGGSNIYGALAMDTGGDLYGATCSSGAFQQGSVFKLSPNGHGSWSYSTLHDFTGGDDGACPLGGVILDSSGNIYGTTEGGGTNGFGTVFRITA